MILLNDFKKQWQDIGDDAVKTFAQVGSSGWYILGTEVVAFEKALAEFWQLNHAVGVANGLDAIQIALQATGCKVGDRVLTTPLSAFATTLAILRLGATPIFIDIDPYGLIDLDLVEQVLASDPTIRFFVPVHLFGHACDLERLHHLHERFGITIIEDCAQSIGAKWKGASTGTVGAIACTSFYPTKNLGVLGDGGALLTNSDELHRLAHSLRDYGQSSKYKHDLVGWNSRLDEIHAAFLSHVAVPRLQTWTTRRKEIAETYLAGIDHASIKSLGRPEHSDSCWHLFPLLVDPARKKDFRSHLQNMGVQTGEHYPIPIHDQEALKGVRIEVPLELSRTERFCQSEVSIPIHPYLTASEVNSVIAAINGWKG
ncbi:MAG: DegT/DnrJ/EryC1/StrS family aminotransferase [Edaphobacter sp.]